MTNLTRRGLLTGLLGTAAVAALPLPVPEIERPMAIGRGGAGTYFFTNRHIWVDDGPHYVKLANDADFTNWGPA